MVRGIPPRDVTIFNSFALNTTKLDSRSELLREVMAVGALAGGALGGRLAGKIKPVTLRRIVIAIGLVVAAIYFVR